MKFLNERWRKVEGDPKHRIFCLGGRRALAPIKPRTRPEHNIPPNEHKLDDLRFARYAGKLAASAILPLNCTLWRAGEPNQPLAVRGAYQPDGEYQPVKAPNTGRRKVRIEFIRTATLYPDTLRASSFGSLGRDTLWRVSALTQGPKPGIVPRQDLGRTLAPGQST